MLAKRLLIKLPKSITYLSQKIVSIDEGNDDLAVIILRATKPTAPITEPRRQAKGARKGPPKRALQTKNAAITYSRLSTTIGRVGLTAVFGMETGVSPHVLSPRR